jgi:hypothetical protein
VPTARASEAAEHAAARGGQHLDVRRPGERGVRVAALRPDHAPPDVERGAVPRARGRVGVRAAAEGEHLRGHGQAHLDQVVGPAAASTSTASATSSALPTPRPSGDSIDVSSATVRTPCAAPRPTMVSASARAASTVGMNAPRRP